MKEEPQYNIIVNVKTTYVEQQSDPDKDHYVFAYTVNIKNQGSNTARLMSRHWVITDANGRELEVAGSGVVGEQPFLRPGEEFEYTSGAALETPVGCMQGHYQMVSDNGTPFEALIPAFTLSQPNLLN